MKVLSVSSLSLDRIIYLHFTTRDAVASIAADGNNINRKPENSVVENPEENTSLLLILYSYVLCCVYLMVFTCIIIAQSVFGFHPIIYFLGLFSSILKLTKQKKNIVSVFLVCLVVV